MCSRTGMSVAKLLLSLAAVAALVVPALAEGPTAEEMKEARRWVAAKFDGVAQKRPPEAQLTVNTDHDRNTVRKNVTWTGKKLKIGSQVFDSGLSCHAKSSVAVRLPSPGQTFSAVIGVDNNDWSGRVSGTVVFSVVVAGKEVYRSKVMRTGDRGVRIEVPLNGASEFVIEVGDAGDGFQCDYADWADARVVLSGGDVVRLGGSQSGAIDAAAPFSFDYGGKLSSQFLSSWKTERSSRKIDDNRVERSVVYTDPDTGLVVRCKGIEYRDFPVVEWTLHFSNTGQSNTPIISNIRAVDARFECGEPPLFLLHHQLGSTAWIDEYQPIDTLLKPGEKKHITTVGGRPTNSDLPYFNLEWQGAGVIAVIGWPGQWAADFEREGANSVRVRGGQETTHFELYPGEDVRSPLIVLQFWRGDQVHAQNVWRRWMLAHNLPRPGGKLPAPQWNATSGVQFADMQMANEQNQKQFIDLYIAEGLKIDYWWMDHGWFYFKPPKARYEADKTRFPRGFRSITDYAHSKGIKSMVWFEPEHYGPGYVVYDEHPEWLLGGALLNLGNPDAWKWLVESIDGQLVKEGIDLYRSDFNIEPLELWTANDTANRQGITEIRYVTGYLAFWDELKRRHPNMLIDACASGGKRNDLETMRRAVPLWRSDFNNVAYHVMDYRIAPLETLPLGSQCMTYGLARWLPYFGTIERDDDVYSFRSCMCPSIVTGWDLRNTELNFKLLRQMTDQWRQVAHCYQGDYYPLTSYSNSQDSWMAWQFDRPDLGEGMIQAFRRGESPIEVCRLQLEGLKSDGRYAVKNLDTGKSTAMSGDELMTKGLVVRMPSRPAAVLLTYKLL